MNISRIIPEFRILKLFFLNRRQPHTSKFGNLSFSDLSSINLKTTCCLKLKMQIFCWHTEI